MSGQRGDRRGAYVDASAVHWDANDADLEAFFVKRSKYLGSMRRRYMMLKKNKIFFARSDVDAPHGVIDLVDTLSVGQLVDPGDVGKGPSSTGAHHSIRSSPKKEAHGRYINIQNREEAFLLEAEDARTAAKWVEYIQSVIRPSY